MSRDTDSDAARPSTPSIRRRLAGSYVLVFAVATIARLVPVVRGGGFRGDYGYDPSVYYAAADALIHGRVPYRDYLLVHPPAIALVLTPFALLGRLTSDHLGFAAANLAMTLLGALNAVLVVHFARKLGLATRAAVIGGLFYAVWFGAIQSEFLVRLEPLGNFVLLGALIVFRSAADADGRRARARYLLGGVALGVGMSLQIWWVVPAFVLLAWQWRTTRSLRRVVEIAGGTLVAMAVIDGPFLILSRGRMISLVFSDQLTRYYRGVSVDRFSDLAATIDTGLNLSTTTARALAVAIGLGFLVVAVAALQIPAVRPFVILLLGQLAVLLISPPWYSFYTDYVAVPAALTIAGGAAWCAAHPGFLGRTGSWLPLGVTAAITAVVLGASGGEMTGASPRVLVKPFADSSRMARAARSSRCIMSNTPMALIALNALDRSFEPGCHNAVDVTAPYIDGAGRKADRVTGHPNPYWSADFYKYLTSGDAVILDQVFALSADAQRAINRNPVITSNGTEQLRRIRLETTGAHAG